MYIPTQRKEGKMEDRQTDGRNYKLSKLTEMLPIFSTKGTDRFQKFLMFSFSITVPLDSEEETPLGQREEGKDNLEISAHANLGSGWQRTGDSDEILYDHSNPSWIWN